MDYEERDGDMHEGEHAHCEQGEMHYVGRIKRIESSNKNFRGEFLGWFDETPIEGERFIAWGEALDNKGMRLVSTSPVVEIIKEDEAEIVFRTENSLYAIERY